jgi:hypothetical protein
LRPLELPLNEKQIPQVVGNNRKAKQKMEGLERIIVLEKQEHCMECI